MTTYYIAEVQNSGSKREATKIEAASLSEAKRIATKERCFQGTVLQIGSGVNRQNFLEDVLAQKVNGVWG